MKITPIEIRQKTFEKAFRGYEKEEVDAFLVSLSQEWERVNGDIQELKQRLGQAESDVQRLREVESSLYRTLKTAEDTGATLVEQANRDSELQLKEAQMQSDAILNDAKNQARDLIDDAELKARDIAEGLKDEIKKLESDYRTIENQRDNLILEMKNLASGIIERLNSHKSEKVDFSQAAKSINTELEKQAISIELKEEAPIEEESIEVSPELEVAPKVEVQWEVTPREEESSKENNEEEEKGSFFDSLG